MKKYKVLFTMFTLLVLVLSACSTSDTSSSNTAEDKETSNTNSNENMSANDNNGETIVMQVATPTSNDPQTYAMDLFKERLEEETDGRIQVDLYPGSQLGSNDQMLQQLTSGSIHGLLEPTAFLGGFEELMTVVDLPYLWPDVQQAVEYLNGEGGQLFENKLNEKGVTALRYYEYGNRILLLKNKIESMDDFNGQKIRVMGAPVLVDQINAWGGTGVAMGVPELYPALEQGTIDGLESASMFFYAMKYHELANYLLMEPKGAEVTIFMGNKEWLDSLPEDLRQAVYDVAAEITEDVHTYARENDELSVTKMQEEGIEVIESSPEFHEQLVNATDTVYSELIERVPEAEEVIAEIQAYFAD